MNVLLAQAPDTTRDPISANERSLVLDTFGRTHRWLPNPTAPIARSSFVAASTLATTFSLARGFNTSPTRRTSTPALRSSSTTRRDTLWSARSFWGSSSSELPSDAA